MLPQQHLEIQMRMLLVAIFDYVFKNLRRARLDVGGFHHQYRKAGSAPDSYGERNDGGIQAAFTLQVIMRDIVTYTGTDQDVGPLIWTYSFLSPDIEVLLGDVVHVWATHPLHSETKNATEDDKRNERHELARKITDVDSYIEWLKSMRVWAWSAAKSAPHFWDPMNPSFLLINLVLADDQLKLHRPWKNDVNSEQDILKHFEQFTSGSDWFGVGQFPTEYEGLRLRFELYLELRKFVLEKLDRS